MKTPIALSMLLSPFSLPHDERWVLPLALGLFALLAVFSAWRQKTEEGDKWRFRKKLKVTALCWFACEVLWQLHGEGTALYFAPLTGIVFLCVLSEALVYGVYLLAKKKRQAAM